MHMHMCMHMHMPHAPCPMPHAQALAQEVDKVNTELQSRFGCYFQNRVTHLVIPSELPSKPWVWDTQGQCKGITRRGDRCKVHTSSKCTPTPNP